jgi:D-alanyl-D-alanine carboxypeptidase
MLSLVAALLVALQGVMPASAALDAAYNTVNQGAAETREAMAPRTKSLLSATYAAIPVADSAIALSQDNKAAMLYDVDSTKVLYEKNTSSRLPIASITKVMTAVVLLQNHSLDETITIPALPQQPPGSQVMNVQPGEQFTLSEAMTAMLTYSANDMAVALAIWDSGSELAFVDKMNDQALQWGLKDTRYTDATGLSQQGSYSTAQDLTVLATIALRSNFFRQATSQPRVAVKTLTGKTYNLPTTNQLLGRNGVIGTKTGYTLEAGQCLLSLTRRDGREIIGVMLGSNDRFGQTRTLLNTAYATYRWE